MALFIGKQDQKGNSSIFPADLLIAKSLNGGTIRDKIKQILGCQLGTIRFELFPQHAMTTDPIDSDAKASTYASDGWVYPNGSYIAKEIFPEMYEVLNTITYPLDGNSKTYEADSLTYIKLPNLSKYLYPNNNPTPAPVISYVDGQYQPYAHQHDIAMSSGGETQITLPKVAWIYSTHLAGKGDPNIESTTFSSSAGNIYSIPRTSSAHSGDDDEYESKKSITWDLPIPANNTVKKTLKSDTSFVKDGVVPVADQSTARPKTIECSFLMFIGFPKTIGR